MGSLLAYLRSRFFWLNVVAALIVVMLLLGLTYHWLNKYTHHGETITVPELRKKNISELAAFLKFKQLNFSVSDSSIYDIKLSPGTVIEQDPKPNEKVKEGRTIYVTITRFNAPEIRMPDLIDGSYRQAEKILQSLGIKIGETIYKPDLAKNAVLAIQVNGFTIKPGEFIAKGTTVDLVLGDGLGNRSVEIPELYNLTKSEALFILKGSALLAGKIEYDGTVMDTSEAKIYKQEPAPFSGQPINQGDVIDLFFTQSQSVLNQHLPKK